MQSPNIRTLVTALLESIDPMFISNFAATYPPLLNTIENEVFYVVKIGEDQSPEDAEDGLPELPVMFY